MKVFIVYTGEFCTDKPRTYMAEPSVNLVTTNKEKAYEYVDKLFRQYSQRTGIDITRFNDGCFTFEDGCDTYGSVGFMEVEVEVED